VTPRPGNRVLVLNHGTTRQLSVCGMLRSYDLELAERNWSHYPPQVDGSYDVIIVVADTCCPSAIGACADIRRQVTEPLVLIANDHGEECQVRAYGVGVDECILTPVSRDLLYAKLTRWLRWSKMNNM
jgi:DNA-binding response OmpR family regulator